jgi:hypothetical protein
MLGESIDGERQVATGTVACVHAPGMRPELGKHSPAQLQRELEHEIAPRREGPSHS